MSSRSSPPAPLETGTSAASALSAHIASKRILITGVSPGGLGAKFAATIAAHSPSCIYLAGRSRSKLESTAETLRQVAGASEVRIVIVELDLLSDVSVRKAAKQILDDLQGEALDVLVLNAGIMAVEYRSVTWRQGTELLESQFAGNHIGHFLLSGLLMEGLLKAEDGGRVVSVSSDGYRLGPVRFGDLGFDGGKVYDPWLAYGQSKSANMLFVHSLAEKLGSKGLVAVSLHPGVIGETNLGSHGPDFEALVELDVAQGNAQKDLDYGKMRYLNLDEGTATHVRAAFDPTLKKYNGRYLENSKPLPLEDVKSWGRDAVEAKKLWSISEHIAGERFNW